MPTNMTGYLTVAIVDAVDKAVIDEMQEIVASETRAAFREHGDAFTALIRKAVAEAVADILKLPARQP